MRQTLIRTMFAISTIAFTSASLAQDTISAVGSSSVTPLMETFGEVYSKAHPNIFIEVQGPGSSAGVKAAKSNAADLGMASRELKESEKEPELKTKVIARDGIAVVVNPNNEMTQLTSKQIQDIYKGKIKNWKEVGGADKPIVAITRDTASGTRGAFEDIMSLKQKINGKKVSAISQHAQVANGNGALKTSVASNPYAIGYISLGTVDSSVKALSVDSTEPTVSNVKNGSYKVARPFLVLYKGQPNARTNDFLQWMSSEEAQKIVDDNGYISIH